MNCAAGTDNITAEHLCYCDDSVASASLVVYALPYINLQQFVYKTRNIRY